MIYRFVNDPDMNINFDDNTLYTPLYTPVDVEDAIIRTNKKQNTDGSKPQKPVSEPSRKLSLLTWFIIVAIILVCLWYVYGGAHSPTQSNPNDNTNVQPYSPDYGTHMKYGIY